MNIDTPIIRIINPLRFRYVSDNAVVKDVHHYPHTHDFCELYFYIGGNCSYMVENGLFSLTPGTVIITRPGELHSVMIDSECMYERAYYQIYGGAFDFFGNKSVMRCFYDRPFGMDNTLVLDDASFGRCLERLRRSAHTSENGGVDRNLRMFSDALEILYEVNACFDRRDGIQKNKPRDELVNSAMRYITQNLSELHSTAELASKLYVSREYLSRRFSDCTGMTLSRYMTLKRIELAKSMLADGRELADVCGECGWRDYSYFIAVFRREVGMTPVRYRSEIAGRNYG